MLMAISLAEKLGRRGLVAVSLHPGVIRTNLSKHLDWTKEYASLSTPTCAPQDKMFRDFVDTCLRSVDNADLENRRC